MNYTYITYSLCVCLFAGGAAIFRSKPGRLSQISRKTLEMREELSIKGNWLKRWLEKSRFFEDRQRRTMEREIYEGLSMLRNMISIGNAADRSADAAVSMLAEKDGVMQPVYINFLRLLRLDRREEAADMFFKYVNIPMGREFAGLLLKWDEIAPIELNEILISHQKTIKEAIKTEQKRIDETVSDLIYLPVVINVMAVFLNFIYIAYFMQQREILRMMF